MLERPVGTHDFKVDSLEIIMIADAARRHYLSTPDGTNWCIRCNLLLPPGSQTGYCSICQQAKASS